MAGEAISFTFAGIGNGHDRWCLFEAASPRVLLDAFYSRNHAQQELARRVLAKLGWRKLLNSWQLAHRPCDKKIDIKSACRMESLQDGMARRIIAGEWFLTGLTERG